MKKFSILFLVLVALATFGMADPVSPVVGSQTQGKLTLEWSIVKQVGGQYDGWWYYTYTLTASGSPELSHFTLQVTPDVFVYQELVFNGTEVEPGDNVDPSSGGAFSVPAWIKFDGLDEGTLQWTFSFYSPNSPVRGDAYAKAGPGGEIFSSIFRPNGPAQVPEPATLALLGFGLLAGGFAWRRRG